MRLIYTIMTILALLTVSAVNEQNPNPKIGTYGAYIDISTFTELTLNSDNTFKYHDQFELGGTFKYIGEWKFKGNKLILFDCENNTIRPMPIKWRIKGTELISEKVKNVVTGIKRRVELNYKKE